MYRGSGVLNFASGAIGISGAFAAWQLGEAGVPFLPAALAGVLLSAVIGAGCHLGIMRVLEDGFGQPQFVPPKVLVDLVEAGHLGQKTGKGFHTYPR